MKPSSKRAAGVVLIVLSILTLPIAVFQVVPTFLVDFPCMGPDEWGYPQDITQSTRIGYCISLYPLKAFSGGGIYASGSTAQDEITVDPLVFKRADEVLYVNSHPLQSGEVYKTTLWKLSANPWLIFTTRFEIRNDGFTSVDSSSTAKMLFVSGDASEGWLPNPLGLIILVGGIWLVARGKEEQNQMSSNLAQAG
jgi:hypothetical protein